MHRILASITRLEQHAQALAGDSEAYRPTACPRCQRSGLWRHGFYERKADRRVGVSADESLNPVAVPRFLCPACVHTCSRLPACISPRRWYDWAVQQFVLLMLLAGCSVHRCAVCTGRERHTVRRWRDWLSERSEVFASGLLPAQPAPGVGPLRRSRIVLAQRHRRAVAGAGHGTARSRPGRPVMHRPRKRRRTAWTPPGRAPHTLCPLP